MPKAACSMQFIECVEEHFMDVIVGIILVILGALVLALIIGGIEQSYP